jgi:ATP-dependent protease HslVU (ClpYQ) ATPase subunit
MIAHGLSTEELNIKPRKILLIGTLGSGKTTVAQRLAQDAGFPYASIDGCRIRYGDGTVEGEGMSSPRTQR